MSLAVVGGGSKCKVPQLSASYSLIACNHANIPNSFKTINDFHETGWSNTEGCMVWTSFLPC